MAFLPEGVDQSSGSIGEVDVPEVEVVDVIGVDVMGIVVDGVEMSGVVIGETELLGVLGCGAVVDVCIGELLDVGILFLSHEASVSKGSRTSTDSLFIFIISFL